MHVIDSLLFQTQILFVGIIWIYNVIDLIMKVKYEILMLTWVCTKSLTCLYSCYYDFLSQVLSILIKTDIEVLSKVL